MLIYNSLTRRKDELKPVEPNKIRMYVCGMTVYDFCHLGHARMLVSFDVVQRWLRCLGYEVTYVRNVTDIDDKIIRRAVATQKRLHQVTSFFTDAMHADERALNVQSPDHEPRATRHVQGMVEIIQALEENGLAYQSSDGDVNFRVRQFADYGKLSGRSLDEMRAGERITVSDAKEDPLDFVLWKASKAEDPEDSKWDSPYGVGRPGWHIECSAMSRDLLGMPLDIHGGGPDLKFPHHENEIAQSEGAYGGSLANLWMHCGPLMVDDDKMSKSLGNFMTIRQVIGTDKINPEIADYQYHKREAEMLRFFIVRNHYRSQQNFAPNNLNDAQVAVDRFYQGLNTVGFDEVEIDWDSSHAQAFKEAMNDDFNTPVAMAVLFEMLNQANREKDRALMSQMRALGGVLGILQHQPAEYLRSYSRYTRLGQTQDSAVDLSDDAIEAFIKQRTEAKNAKDYALADQIREQLKQAGIELEDVAGGLTQWRRI
ncbi:Cysteine--tRNA ligase [Oligella ureolytica]|uniref:Cysteine--tRNA ligase n=1 Tax=Oligella ureolytica TaxID=90244 RepID=A0A378XHG2_9BURK|nr:cysteine--tRNA ligase [Oligella ureolytica]QPT39793.1 cysteine--tRNA ligase [Oligella ureolytica]SUA57571.1 Cysteine--tRNA ligase [Oligella ureolytica]